MRRVVLVFVGGFCGTVARYLLAAPLLALARIALPDGAGFPYDILVINLTGALALGLIYGLVERGSAITPGVRLTVGTGFLGAYTTFSSFVVGGDKLIAAGSAAEGITYLLGSIALGVAAAHGGYLLSGVVGERRRISRIVLDRTRRWQCQSPLPRLVSRTMSRAALSLPLVGRLQPSSRRTYRSRRLPLRAPRHDRANHAHAEGQSLPSVDQTRDATETAERR